MTAGRLFPRDSAQSCRAADLYVSPKGGQTVKEGPLTLQWNPECVRNASNIDIYLYSHQQQSANIPIHAWTRIEAESNHVNVSLDSRWWNATDEAKMNIQIVDSGHLPWDTNHPISHTWTVTNPGGGSEGSSFNIVKMGLITDFGSSTGLSKGALAAAVICPIVGTLIFLIAAFIFVHRRNRNKHIKEREEMRERSMYSYSMTHHSTPYAGSTVNAGDPAYTYYYSTQPYNDTAAQFPAPDVEAGAATEALPEKSSEHESLKSISENASASGAEIGATSLRHKPPSDRSRSNPSRLDKWDSDFWYVTGPQETEQRERKHAKGARATSKGSRGKKREHARVKRKVHASVDAPTVEESGMRHASSNKRRTGSIKQHDSDGMRSDVVPEYGPTFGEMARAQAPATITSNVPASLLGPRVIPEPDWAPEPTGKAERDAKIASFLQTLPAPGESYDGDNMSRVGGSGYASRHSAMSDTASIQEYTDAATHAHED